MSSIFNSTHIVLLCDSLLLGREAQRLQFVLQYLIEPMGFAARLNSGVNTCFWPRAALRGGLLRVQRVACCYCCLLNQSKFRQMSYPTYTSIDPKNTPVMIVSLFA